MHALLVPCGVGNKRASPERATLGHEHVAGLYPIVDLDALSSSTFGALAFAERVLRVRPEFLQLRAKHASAKETLELLEGLLPLCRAAGTLLFHNDRPDLALLAGADGVHVGQDDLPVAAVRRFAPALRIGISTHDLQELEIALDERPAYVAFGPIFPTRSKSDAESAVGLEALAVASRLAKASRIPLVAIGGIGDAAAKALSRLGVTGAVISALFGDSLDAVEAKAIALHAALTPR
jgi:thiamine-phosphate pyrophosphorylase